MGGPVEYDSYSGNVVFWTLLGIIALPLTGSIVPLLIIIISLMLIHMVTGGG